MIEFRINLAGTLNYCVKKHVILVENSESISLSNIKSKYKDLPLLDFVVYKIEDEALHLVSTFLQTAVIL